jgi:stage II sporulation protein E
MMALCDGMGSGERAGRISETAIDLVECFFKAGFDGKFVLENVNRFLAMDEEESFAAFDILVCDLNSLERVMIKMGSPTSYIKKETVTERIEGAALPLGALMELKPFVSAEKSEEGETIVFVSDGVSDVLTDEGIANLIAYTQTRSVKKLCDEILSAAKERAKEVSDDMTVVAVKIIKRVA